MVSKFLQKNLWPIIAALLFVLLLSVLVSGSGCPAPTAGVISAQAATDKALDFINAYLLQGTTATLINVSEQDGLYAIVINVGGRAYTSYVTKDGELLFPSAINLSQEMEIPADTGEATGQIPKSEEPEVQLFVMSFCPYGQEAEAAMAPVVSLLGNTVTIEPHFIVSINGETVNSLHGNNESQEDMRQACIWENYAPSVWWNYTSYVDSACSLNNIATCWKTAAAQAKVNVTVIEACVASEGLDLMSAEEALAAQYSVSSSPTLIINGVKYQGGRTPEAFKQAICGAFTSAPAACNQTLSGTATAQPTGGC